MECRDGAPGYRLEQTLERTYVAAIIIRRGAPSERLVAGEQTVHQLHIISNPEGAPHAGFRRDIPVLPVLRAEAGTVRFPGRRRSATTGALAPERGRAGKETPRDSGARDTAGAAVGQPSIQRTEDLERKHSFPETVISLVFATSMGACQVRRNVVN